LTRTIRISQEAHDALLELSQASGDSIQRIIDEAVKEYRRSKIFDQANAAYAALRSNPETWQETEREREEWDMTLVDCLDLGTKTDERSHAPVQFRRKGR
jgi:hypothetical protein